MLDRAVAYAEAGADAVWIGLPTTQDYVKAAGMIKKPLMATIGGANMPATAAAMKAARVAVGNATSMGKHCVGRHRQSPGRIEGHRTNDFSRKGGSGPGDGGKARAR